MPDEERAVGVKAKVELSLSEAPAVKRVKVDFTFDAQVGDGQDNEEEEAGEDDAESTPEEYDTTEAGRNADGSARFATENGEPRFTLDLVKTIGHIVDADTKERVDLRHEWKGLMRWIPNSVLSIKNQLNISIGGTTTQLCLTGTIYVCSTDCDSNMNVGQAIRILRWISTYRSSTDASVQPFKNIALAEYRSNIVFLRYTAKVRVDIYKIGALLRCKPRSPSRLEYRSGHCGMSIYPTGVVTFRVAGQPTPAACLALATRKFARVFNAMKKCVHERW
ncbi:hypothetical protein DIPPA_01789 [Diplonema papillatum]|nr:hypothetical protein DIPPA_01789 [Diplonema papillatum]|eukprot:gene4901-7570_t